MLNLLLLLKLSNRSGLPVFQCPCHSNRVLTRLWSVFLVRCLLDGGNCLVSDVPLVVVRKINLPGSSYKGTNDPVVAGRYKCILFLQEHQIRYSESVYISELLDIVYFFILHVYDVHRAQRITQEAAAVIAVHDKRSWVNNRGKSSLAGGF